MRPKEVEDAGSAFASLPGEEVLAALHTTLNGLEPEEASARLRRAGTNSLPERERHLLLLEFAKQFTHFFALVLWLSAGLAFIGGMPQLGWAVMVVVVVNGLFSFLQEYRAERATRALAALLPRMALVRRAGTQRSIPAANLVGGDILVLVEGARISADARILKSTGLRVDNSALTGESEPVERSPEMVDGAHTDWFDCSNLVFAGAWVISGSALAVVTATGASTQLGTISQMAGSVRRRMSPLRLSVNRAVRVMGIVTLSGGVLFALASVLLGMKVQDSLLFSVGVIVALVPEGLLPTLTLALAMSAARMARRGALVRHLEAVETLGSTTVICTDKTGTLTTNQMTVVQAWTYSGALRVTGTGNGAQRRHSHRRRTHLCGAVLGTRTVLGSRCPVWRRKGRTARWGLAVPGRPHRRRTRGLCPQGWRVTCAG